MSIFKNLFKRKMTKVIKGYKGFDKDMKCRGFQFEEGKEYKHDGEVKTCSGGFHFCENPLDVLNYYNLTNSKFAEVEGSGEIDQDGDKTAVSNIRIVTKLDLPAFIKASVEFVWYKASNKKVSKGGNATSGNDAHSATSGYGAHSATSGNDAHSATSGSYAHSATSGERANSATSGYGAHSATSGNDGIACSVGRKAKAKASLGCWIVLAEWKEGDTYTDAKPVGIKSIKVDGKKVKADTWYKLSRGKFVETDDSNE